MVWNLGVQGRALTGAVYRYLPFWVGLVGGSLAWVGVVLPHVVMGTRAAGILVALIIIPIAAWFTHVIVCIQASEWFLLIAGAIMFPIAIVHGIGIWFGAWG